MKNDIEPEFIVFLLVNQINLRPKCNYFESRLSQYSYITYHVQIESTSRNIKLSNYRRNVVVMVVTTNSIILWNNNVIQTRALPVDARACLSENHQKFLWSAKLRSHNIHSHICLDFFCLVSLYWEKNITIMTVFVNGVGGWCNSCRVVYFTTGMNGVFCNISVVCAFI